MPSDTRQCCSQELGYRWASGFSPRSRAQEFDQKISIAPIPTDRRTDVVLIDGRALLELFHLDLEKNHEDQTHIARSRGSPLHRQGSLHPWLSAGGQLPHSALLLRGQGQPKIQSTLEYAVQQRARLHAGGQGHPDPNSDTPDSYVGADPRAEPLVFTVPQSTRSKEEIGAQMPARTQTKLPFWNICAPLRNLRFFIKQNQTRPSYD
jgi:hypothetical protein